MFTSKSCEASFVSSLNVIVSDCNVEITLIKKINRFIFDTGRSFK